MPRPRRSALSPATCETMKNLILGGIRAFELVDDGAWRRARATRGRGVRIDVRRRRARRARASGKTMVETVVERLAALNPGVDGAATTANARATANAGKERFERVRRGRRGRRRIERSRSQSAGAGVRGEWDGAGDDAGERIVRRSAGRARANDGRRRTSRRRGRRRGICGWISRGGSWGRMWR